MRIAYLVNQYPTVSHTFIRREVLALERQGFEIDRMTLREWGGELMNPEDRRERERTHTVLQGGAPALSFAAARALVAEPGRFMQALRLAWSMSRRSERPFSVHLVYLAEACRVAAWLRAWKVEHLHAHFGTNSAAVAMLSHVLGGPRWSFTVHGPDEFDRPQFIALPEKLRRCAFAVAISSYGRAQLYRFVEHEHWSKIHVVHCGIEPTYSSSAVAISPSARRFVSVGRLSAPKGHLLLVEAARRLAAKGYAFEVVLAGDGNLRGDLEALIARHKLQDKVRITGWISSDQVREEILAARALVQPSFAEGLPVVIMEAMALQRPIISTYVAGIPELVRPGEHGWLVPAGDIDALVEAMQACLDAPADALARMAAAARDRVLARHDVDREAKKLMELIQGANERCTG
jgi:glycosyltransferase involved in cell wall biosynthesis